MTNGKITVDHNQVTIRLSRCKVTIDKDFKSAFNFIYDGVNPKDLFLTLDDVKDLLEVMTH